MRLLGMIALLGAPLLCSSFSFESTFLGSQPVVARESIRTRAPTGATIEMISHGKRFAKLGLPADQRKALLRALTTEVIRHGRIKTTHVRAKAVRPWVDKMIGLSKDGSLHAKRQALGYIYDKELVHNLFEKGPERYGDRNGGYCRVLRTMARHGDNAKMGIIELV